MRRGPAGSRFRDEGRGRGERGMVWFGASTTGDDMESGEEDRWRGGGG